MYEVKKSGHGFNECSIIHRPSNTTVITSDFIGDSVSAHRGFDVDKLAVILAKILTKIESLEDEVQKLKHRE